MKAFCISIAIHALIAVSLGAFAFTRPEAPQNIAPIEVQLADIHVHQAEVPDHPPEVKEMPRQHEPKEPKTLTQTEDSAPKAAANPPAPVSAHPWESFSSGERNAYLEKLMRIISSRRYYPKASILNEEEGVVQLRVTLGSGGVITACELAKTSGFARLDEAAIQTLKNIGTLPMPEENQASVTLFIPIRYEIHPKD